MPFVRILNLRSALARTPWRRGLRAGLTVGGAMLLCHLLGRPTGWAALGGLQTIMVDNGGPYRTRLANILTVLVGMVLAVFVGVLAGSSTASAVAVTFVFCFAATLARVLSQPFAACSVIVLVTYVVAVGSGPHTPATAITATVFCTLGGLWAALLSLLLWPADPFRPARQAIAQVYASLERLIALLPQTATHEGTLAFNAELAPFRLALESARLALSATPARMTARTVRARNLTVLSESADLLLARLLRLAELGTPSDQHADQQPGDQRPGGPTNIIAAWLAKAVAPIQPALLQRPLNNAAAFAPEGSLTLDLRRTLSRVEADLASTLPGASGSHLRDALHDSLLSLETAYEAVRAIWTGYEGPRTSAATFSVQTTEPHGLQRNLRLWRDTLQSNLTVRSVMFRHALRLGAVVALDEWITHLLPVSHGYWLAMTSLIVLQPYTGETVSKSTQRVLGTVAGAVLASLFAAVVPGPWSMMATITLGAVFSVAFYAVDYAWYCFFLTPTIVLMTLPHLHDWHFAAVRMAMTCLGALVAVAAMLLLWPERESLQLPRLLARGAAADAAYLRAAIAFWKAAAVRAHDGGQQHRNNHARFHAERTLLAPARRLCGLATNDAEETLDRALLEHDLPLNPARQRTGQLNRSALTFTIYLRRLTQTITTTAAIGSSTTETAELVESLAARLDAVSHALDTHQPLTPGPTSGSASGPSSGASSGAPAATDGVPDGQMQRLLRQVSVLERTAAELTAASNLPS